MPNHSDVVRLNLEYYRKQAKALLKASKAGDSAALQRLRRDSPELKPMEDSGAESTIAALHHAQLVIAKEQGFSSWPRFKTFIVESQVDVQGLVTTFIDAAVSDGQRAEAMLVKNPKIADAGFYVALVLGNWKSVEQVVTERSTLAKEKSGPQNCEPLLYVCFSRYNSKASHSKDLAETARILLRYGADPNAFFTMENLPNNPLPCLYAATGLNNNPELGLVLLEAGANPNDSESLYHSTEHRDLACVRLLLRHGATPTGTNALNHMLDREDIEGLKLLLASGANPNEVNDRGETALHWAVWRGRSMETIATLLDNGADVNMQRNDSRTAYALAILGGQTEVAALLEARGAKTDLSAFDQFVFDIRDIDSKELDRWRATQPEVVMSPGNQRLVPDLTMSHRTSAVRVLLGAGLPVDARGEMGGTALHWACWKGYADLVQLLLDHGASLTAEDEQFHGTPPGWFGHGVRNCNEGAGDYAQVARMLIAAGATIPAVDLPTGKPEVDAVLREHGLI